MQSTSLSYRSAGDRWAAAPCETVDTTALRSRPPKHNDSTIGQFSSCADPFEYPADSLDPSKLKKLPLIPAVVPAGRRYASADDHDLWKLSRHSIDPPHLLGCSSSWLPRDTAPSATELLPSPLWFSDQTFPVSTRGAGLFPAARQQLAPRTHSVPPYLDSYGSDFPSAPVDIALPSFSAPNSPEPVVAPGPEYVHHYNWLWAPTHAAAPTPTGPLNPFPITATFKVNTQRADGRTRRQDPSCLFCRARKIACRRPPRVEGEVVKEGDTEGSCDQCLRRGRSPSQCVYPKESRRGHHSRIKSLLKRQAATAAAGPTTM